MEMCALAHPGLPNGIYVSRMFEGGKPIGLWERLNNWRAKACRVVPGKVSKTKAFPKLD